jgi:LuxR family maltose regulon positive regulatory protein
VQEAERYVPEALPARQRRIVLGGIDQVRARIAVFSGNIPQAISLAHRSLELLPEEEVIPRMGAIDVMAHAYLVSGDVTPAEHEIATAHALVHPSINVIAAVSCITLLARLHVLQGRLREAAATYARVVQVVPRPEVLQTIFNILLYYFGLGNLLREWNDLEAAERHLLQGMALVNDTLTVEPFVAALGYTALARLQQARGNTLAALATLDALERLAEQRHFAVHLMPQLAAVRAQLELARGNKASAIRWADSSGLSVEDADLPYPREGEYLALVRVRIAQARADPATPFLQDALHLLDRLLQDAEPKARMGSVLEILVLHALALEVQGNRPGALSTLRRALALAEPEGYIRLFVDEGPPMFALLRHAHARGIASDYIATLLAAFGEQQAPTLPLSPRPGSLLEPLTEREVEVLRLVARGLTDAQVAETLVISPRTVNAHLRSIYSKLNITSRNAATHFAIEHHLI